MLCKFLAIAVVCVTLYCDVAKGSDLHDLLSQLRDLKSLKEAKQQHLLKEKFLTDALSRINNKRASDAPLAAEKTKDVQKAIDAKPAEFKLPFSQRSLPQKKSESDATNQAQKAINARRASFKLPFGQRNLPQKSPSSLSGRILPDTLRRLQAKFPHVRDVGDNEISSNHWPSYCKTPTCVDYEDVSGNDQCCPTCPTGKYILTVC